MFQKRPWLPELIDDFWFSLTYHPVGKLCACCAALSATLTFFQQVAQLLQSLNLLGLALVTCCAVALWFAFPPLRRA